MPQQTIQSFLFAALMASSPLLTLVSVSQIADAQVIPDSTLGNERSIVRSRIQSERGLIDRIDGGARRGGNLFHSFSDFNVNTGQRVYFSNPANISNIISRVTGRNLSNIDGTLGVLGGANLFLINPNGIAFGPNARLDIRGSFTASTSSRVLFPNGYAFDAVNPNEPPLLTVNAPLGLASWLPSSGTVSNTGTLTAGQDLTLAGANLDLQGQLRGGRDVSLVATRALTARDSATTPLIASAGNNLLVQGNQSLEIDALNRSESGVFSGKEMVLRSNSPVVGDTRFTTGGNFRVERLDGRLGSVISIKDPVFETGGDFAIADYTGASLQILAGGSVTIPGTITITGAGGPFNDSTVTLSNGSSLTLTGTTQPTVDIRAGTTQFFGTPAAGTPTSATIAIGTIINPGGLVFLTNQYQPNPALTGDISVDSINTADTALSGIDGGSVVMDSRGKLSFRLLDTSGGDSTTFDVVSNAGDVTLLATGDIFMPFPSNIFAYGLRGGAILLQSKTSITQEDAPFGTNPFDLGFIESGTFDPGVGGGIRLSAPNIFLIGNIYSSTYGDGQSGDFKITANNLNTNQATIVTTTFGSGNAGLMEVEANSIALNYTFLGSASFSGSGGRGGDVKIQANSIAATTGAQITSGAYGVGDAGNITVNAQTISLSGFQPGELNGGVFVPSSIFSTAQPGSEGNSGNIAITTGTLAIANGGLVGTNSYGVGNAGNITLNATRSINMDGALFFEFSDRTEASAISSEIFQGATGKGGDIAITTPVLNVTGGGVISATSDGDGDAGSIAINATQSATFTGFTSFSEVGQPDRFSRASVRVAENATGNGGTLTITTPSLSLINGGQLTAETNGAGNAGNVRANVANSLILNGSRSGIFANTTPGSTGNGGSIFVSNPTNVTIANGATIAVNSLGSGTAGDIFLQARNLALRNQGVITAETTSNTGGNITLQVNDVIAMQGNSRISTSAGTAGAGGDGGNITINTRYLATNPNQNSDITANAFTGRGGRVEITADGVFGFTVLSRDQLEAALGTTDPNLLDPGQLQTSNITAISRVNPDLNGQVIIQSPDSNPVRGELPVDPQVVDASRLIAQDCAASGVLAQTRGSFVVTGRGGIPASPSDPLSDSTPLVGWDAGTAATQASASTSKQAVAQTPTTLVEVQSLRKRSDGRVVLVASGGSPQFWHPSVNCRATPSVR